MKTNFKFYFLMIIATAFMSSLVYGLAETMVEKHITEFSFGLMLITVACIGGMMKHLTLVPVAQSAK